MRPGVAPLERSAKEAEKIDLQVSILDGVMQTWVESLGQARFALIRHEKAHMLTVPYGNNHLELSIDASMPIEQIGGVVGAVEDVLHQ